MAKTKEEYLTLPKKELAKIAGEPETTKKTKKVLVDQIMAKKAESKKSEKVDFRDE